MCSLPVYLPTKPQQTFYKATFSCNYVAIRKVLVQIESFWLSSNNNTFWARQIVLQLCVCNHRSKYQKAEKTQCNPWRKFYEDNSLSILKIGWVMCKNAIFARPRFSLWCTINSKPKCSCAISNGSSGALVQRKVSVGFHTLSQNLGRVLKQYEIALLS